MKKIKTFSGTYCEDCGFINRLLAWPETGSPTEWVYLRFNLRKCVSCESENLHAFVADCKVKKDGFPKIKSLRKELGVKVWLP